MWLAIVNHARSDLRPEQGRIPAWHHAYATSPIMTATVYSKWINSEADHRELAKLDTRADDFISMKNAEQNRAETHWLPNWSLGRFKRIVNN